MDEKNNKNANLNNNKGKRDDNFQWSRASRTLALWLAIFVLSIWVTMQLNRGDETAKSVTFGEFIELLEARQIAEAEIAGKSFRGKLITPQETEGRSYRWVEVKLPEEPTFETAKSWMQDYDVNLKFKEESPDWTGILLTLLPWILLAAVWLIFLRRMQGGGARGIFSFGKSRAKMLTENHPRITFDDVAGADEAKQELREIIEFLKEPEKFQKLGGRIPKGALLLGPPGTGKTLLAKAVAGEAGVPFFSMSGADFVEMFVGVGASRVRDLFEQGKKNAPCIIFIDEVDAVGRHRGAGLGGGHDEREQTLNQLLVEMDGFDSNEGVILLAATNRPDVLDTALLRPGRFDRQIVVDRPDVRGREGILKVHTRNIAISRDVNLETLAKATPGFSGADLANMVNEAALLAARKNKRVVDMGDLEEAKDKVIMGVARKSLIISDEEKKVTAYHEAGHALVAKFTPGADPIHKVTIIPRGRALGVTTTLPIDEKHNYSKTYCEYMLVHLMGGREAEKLVLKELTTGAGNDLERATELARKMVCEWGMSEAIGPLTYGKKDEEIFLGREISRPRDYSEKTAQIIDQEIARIVNEASKKAHKILVDHLDALHNLAAALLERELLDGNEVDAIISGKRLDGKGSANGKTKKARAATGRKAAAKTPQKKGDDIAAVDASKNPGKEGTGDA